MKKASILFLLFLFTIRTFSQQAPLKQTITKTDYLQKSKKQLKTGQIILGSGAVLIVTSRIIPRGESTGDQFDPIGGGFYEGHKNDGIKGTVLLAGFAVILASGPFFIASGKNKKRETKALVFIDSEQRPVLRGTEINNQSFPVLAVRLKF